MSLRINGERRAETICQQCQKHFMGTIRFNQRFCSVQCQGASRRADYAKWRDPDYVRKYHKEYQAKNRERINAGSVLWGAKNTDKRKISSRASALKRRAQKSAEKRPASPSQIRSVLEKALGLCVYCGGVPEKRLTIDHVDPLATGGRHIVSNLVAACQGCNSSKGSGDGFDWAYERFGLDGVSRVIWFLERRKINLDLYPKGHDTALSRFKRKFVKALHGIDVEVVK